MRWCPASARWKPCTGRRRSRPPPPPPEDAIMTTPAAHPIALPPPAPPSFLTALAVEAYKLRRSLALVLAAVAPLLIAVFLFFNLLRLGKPMPWSVSLQSSAGIWAFFMLPMSVTALTALVAHTEHGPRSWDYLRALPRPRWHLYAAKAVCVLGVVAAMSLLLALLGIVAVQAAGWVKP